MKIFKRLFFNKKTVKKAAIPPEHLICFKPLKDKVKYLINDAYSPEEVEILSECYKRLSEVEPIVREREIEKIRSIKKLEVNKIKN